jgi:hypothetical protein
MRLCISNNLTLFSGTSKNDVNLVTQPLIMPRLLIKDLRSVISGIMVRVKYFPELLNSMLTPIEWEKMDGFDRKYSDALTFYALLLGLLDRDLCGRVTLLLIRGAVASMLIADSCC